MTTTPTIKEQYIAQRFELNGDIESTADVDKLSEKFMKSRLDFAAWYDSKNPSYQLMIDTIAERTTSIIDEEEYDAFIEELANYGINDPEDFEDAYEGEYEGYGERVYAQFAEELSELCGFSTTPEYLINHIDWQTVWYSEIRHDYQAIEFKGNTYFLRNI